MTTSLRAKFDGKVFVPTGPVDMPVGKEVRVVAVDDERPASPRPMTALQRLAAKLAQYPVDANSPTDAAAQHDHYLYGTPKRDDA